jgi:hypothetical protein
MDFTTVNWVVASGIFFGYIIVDGMYVYYTLTIVRRQAFRAASVSFFMHFILAAGVFSYTKNFIYVIPIALGSFVGTYLVTRYAKDELLLPSQDNKRKR